MGFTQPSSSRGAGALLRLAMASMIALAACSPLISTPSGPSGPAQTIPALNPAQPVTIRFENYNLASAGLGRDATLKMIAEFEQKFPHIKVETKATGSQEIFPSIQAQMVAGNPPDVAQLLLREWDLNVEFLKPQDLRVIVPASEMDAHVKGEYPLHPRGLKLTERDGRLQGLAYVFSTPTLFYNVNLFRQAGLDPEKPPKTWDEVKVAADAIKQRASADGFYAQCIEQDWCTQGILYGNGARIMNPERTQITFGEPPALEVYRFWQSMVQSGGHAKVSEKESTELFQAGKLGMLLTTSANQSSLLTAAKGKFEVRASGMPSFGSKPAVPVNSGSSVAMLATDPAKQRASWELMKFLTSERAFTIITSEIGYLPLRTGIVNDERYLKNWEYLPLIRSNLEQMDQLESTYSYPGQNHLQIRKLFLQSLQEVLFEGKDATSTFQETQKRAQDLMPRG